MVRKLKPHSKPAGSARGARGVSLTYEVIDELVDLVKSIRRGLQPVELPPEDQRNQPVWRECLRFAECELKRKMHERSRQIQGPPGRWHPPRLGEWIDAQERRERIPEVVRAAAEHEYRSRDPVIKRLTRNRERPLPSLRERMGELLEWHRPALKAEWQRHGHSPEGMLALYGMTVTGASFDWPFLDHVVQDLLQIRLTLEQEQARGGKALDGGQGIGAGAEGLADEELMAASKVSPDAVNLAKEVRRLYRKSKKNRRVFAERIEEFKRGEGAAHLTAEKKAEEAERAANQAIGEESEAVKAGKATPWLTDSNTPPGDGWVWRTVRYCKHDTQGNDVGIGCAQGWLPADVAARRERSPAEKDAARWPDEPSLAWMFAHLAVFHDGCLRAKTPICHPVTKNPRAVWRGGDAGNKALVCAGYRVMPAVRGDMEAMEKLAGYLKLVSEHLEAGEPSDAETAPPPAKTPEDRARDIALTTDRLFRQNPTWWQDQCDAAVQQCDRWDTRLEEEKRAKPTPTQRAVDELFFKGWDAKWDRWGPADRIWPGPNPTTAAKVLWLVVLHDVATDGRAILEPVTADSAAVGHIEARNFDDGAGRPGVVGDILRASPGPRFNAQGMKRLEGYLEDVGAELAKQSGRSGGVGRDEGEGHSPKGEGAAGGDLPQATPQTDPSLIYQADGATSYNIPKSVLSKAGNKKPGEPGYLWSGRGCKKGQKRERVWFRKADLEKIARSRKVLSRTSPSAGNPREKLPVAVSSRVSGKKSFEEKQRAFLANFDHENTESED
jgi:hypothetical protein